MNLVDSCGWLEYLADGPDAGFFAGSLENPEKLLVPTICITEVFKRVLQQKGEDAALQAAALMQQGNVVDLNSAIAIEAARLGYKHNIPLATISRLPTALFWQAHTCTKPLSGHRTRILRV